MRSTLAFTSAVGVQLALVPNIYSTSSRNGNPANGNHLEICLSSPQKNGNSLTWVLAALSVCFAYPD